MVLACPMLGVCDMLPGSSSSRSAKLVGCKWLMASRPMRELLVIPVDSLAVTTTALSTLEFSVSVILTSAGVVPKVTVRVAVL